MKLFGTVKSFDETKGYGSIKPDAGGGELRFEKSAVQWGSATTPKTDALPLPWPPTPDELLGVQTAGYRPGGGAAATPAPSTCIRRNQRGPDILLSDLI